MALAVLYVFLGDDNMIDVKFAFTFLCVYILLEICKFIINKFMPYISNKYNNGYKALGTLYFILFIIGVCTLFTIGISQLWFYIHRT